MVCKMPGRKIIHIDMDAFYASVEQRDDSHLRGKPVVVAWRRNRSVVCAASYEARKFGVRFAMPAVRAERLCPNAVFLPPDFPRYRAVSRQAREIFQRHTDFVYLESARSPRKSSRASTYKLSRICDGSTCLRSKAASVVMACVSTNWLGASTGAK